MEILRMVARLLMGDSGDRLPKTGLYVFTARLGLPTSKGLPSAYAQLQLPEYRQKENHMKTRAAVAFGAGKPLEICEVDLEGPKAGEVLIEIKATGVCHTDAFTLSGDDPEGAFPTILGHEGAGVVMEVGPGVKSLKVGDHVIPLYTPEDRKSVV